MTRSEVRLALMAMEDLGARTLRLFLASGTTVLAHEWFLEDPFVDGAAGHHPPGGGAGEGFLRVIVHGRHAMIAVRHIAVIEMVPYP